MDERELFKKVYAQVLDYADNDFIFHCAEWGYEVMRMLAQHNRSMVQGGAEQGSPFIYAAATAVIIGEFAERAFNDHFSDETEIDLDLLDIDFERIRDFANEDTEPQRLTILQETDSMGLQDMWTSVCGWKKDIYHSLVYIYEQQGKKSPNYEIFSSLLAIFKDEDGEARNITDAQELTAYEYVSAGFQY